MTLKQWLDSFTPDCDNCLSPESVVAYTAAYYQDQDRKAAVSFENAFRRLQADLPIIDEKGSIQYRDGRSGTYALNEDIQDAILPILQAHGFTLHFETVNPYNDGALLVAVTGILTHKRGHRRSTCFESTADMSGGKTVAQSRGSIMS